MGGKLRQRHNILPIIARAKRLCYVEPFGGACGMLFGKPPEDVEVYNDLNSMLVNLFTVIRSEKNVELFQKLGLSSPHSREIWRNYREVALAWMRDDGSFEKAKEKFYLTDYPDRVVAAFAYFYVMRNGLGGKPNFTAYGYRKPRNSHDRKDAGLIQYWRVLENLLAYQRRLQKVRIENLDFEDCIKRLDDDATLFYLDPPYDVGCSKDYQTGWGKEQTERLIDLCAHMQGGVVLSCYDSPLYETLLKAGYKRVKHKAFMSICKTKREPRQECVYYRFKEKDERRAPTSDLFQN